MKKKLLLILFITFGFYNCASINLAYKKVINKIVEKDAAIWTLDECEKIIKFYQNDNITNKIFNSGPGKLKIFIKAMPLNITTVKAMSRKEVINKRLKEAEFYDIFDNYLRQFTSFMYDANSNRIIEADSNFSKGYTFKFFFENISDPYEPIFLEDGYSYFFLENTAGEFSRVTEVTGLFVEDYFQLDGYLDAVVTFSPFSASGKRLFIEKDLNESYNLVFNGIQTESIYIKCKIEE